MKASEDIEEQVANALDSLSAITMALSVRRVIADGCTLTDAELQAIICALVRPSNRSSASSVCRQQPVRRFHPNTRVRFVGIFVVC